MAKKALTYAEHLEVGARIKAARENLMDAELRICNGLGTSSKACRIMNQIMRRFDEDLKCELDRVLSLTFSEKEAEELRVYYGPISKSKVALLQKPVR